MRAAPWPVVLGLLAGCAPAGATTLSTELDVDPAATRPSNVTVSIFDVHGRLTDTEAPVASTTTQSLGIVAAQLSNERAAIRVVAASSADATLLGGGVVEVVPHHETMLTVVLSHSTVDTDGDGVPDAIDDCPSVADPAQADADGDGHGDACAS